MKPKILIAVVATVAVLAAACSPNPVRVPATTGADSAAPTGTQDTGPLLFGIGMHIEPMGATAQQTGAQAPATGKPDYNNPDDFDRAAESIKTVAGIVAKHGGKMTIQAQSPFTSAAARTGNTVLSDLQDEGNEIGLHFHEDAHLGKDGNTLSSDQWCTVMKEEISLIHRAGVEGDVAYWSGGNLYPHLLDAATCAGLSVNSDWKNPNTQKTDLALVGTVPWRPAGSTNGTDTTRFALHDANGTIVFLPEGNYDKGDFAASRRSDVAGGDEAYFVYLKDQLLRSIDAAQPDKVNVFHFTVHPGEFRGSVTDQFSVIDRFLTEVVDPLVKSGEVKWGTFSEMAAAYAEWEKANPGIDPRAGQSTSATAATPTAAEGTRPPATARTATASTGKVEKDVTYCTGGTSALKMDIYYPTAAAGKTPAVLYVHGGGWTGGTKSSGAGSDSIPELVSRGYLVAAVDYRLAPKNKWPAQIEDVKCAVRYLRANAARYNIDPDRIGAMGGSAGGHLVSMLGVTDGREGLEGTGGNAGVSSRVQAVVDMFGPADLTVEFNGAGQQIMTNVFGVSSHTSEVLKNASPVTWASADDPAFLILQGENDTLVPPSQSQELYDTLKRAGVDAKLVMVTNAGHGFAPEGGQISPSRTQITKMIGDFFDTKLK